MPEIVTPAIKNRILFQHTAGIGLPTLVIFAGIHGNEPASVLAMNDLFYSKTGKKLKFNGNVKVLIGNMKALTVNQRFIHKDLNRIWNRENLEFVRKNYEKTPFPYHELEEMAYLDQQISDIIKTHGASPIIFIDLHTTSANSCPFLPFNDSLTNRKIAMHFPVPLVLGIEEFLDGPLMSHINDLGFPALGFEAGSHQDPMSVERHSAFIQLCLHYLSIISLEHGKLQALEKTLQSSKGVKPGFYEILYRYPIQAESKFIMNPGFQNFQQVTKGHHLATNNNLPIHSSQTGMVFLPLYQAKGQEGFFIVRPVSRFWLWLSKVIRKAGLPDLVVLLPGVDKKEGTENRFQVNPKIARWLRREIFHLFGFRIIFRAKGERMIIIKRD